MSNILKSKRKESSFQIRNEWLNLRLKLSEYLRADFNDNKISYNGTDTLRDKHRKTLTKRMYCNYKSIARIDRFFKNLFKEELKLCQITFQL